MSEFVGSLLWAAHALVLATKVFLTGKKFECAYVRMVGWVVSAVKSQTQWWLIMIVILTLAFAIRSVFVL